MGKEYEKDGDGGNYSALTSTLLPPNPHLPRSALRPPFYSYNFERISTEPLACNQSELRTNQNGTGKQWISHDAMGPLRGCLLEKHTNFEERMFSLFTISGFFWRKCLKFLMEQWNYENEFMK